MKNDTENIYHQQQLKINYMLALDKRYCKNQLKLRDISDN